MFTIETPSGVPFTIDYIELDCITPNSQVVYVAPVSNVDLSTILSGGICGITGAAISISGSGSTGALTNNACKFYRIQGAKNKK